MTLVEFSRMEWTESEEDDEMSRASKEDIWTDLFENLDEQSIYERRVIFLTIRLIIWATDLTKCDVKTKKELL
jgi:hypothetical protein